MSAMETIPVDLSIDYYHLDSDVVKNEFVKKDVCDELFKNVNAIQAVDGGRLVKKSDSDTNTSQILTENTWTWSCLIYYYSRIS